MKISEKVFGDKKVTQYRIKNLDSLKGIISFVDSINNNSKYSVSIIEFSDTNNSSDDGNKTFSIKLNDYDYYAIEKEYNDVDINSANFIVKSGTKTLNLLIDKTFKLSIISYDDTNKLLHVFEKDFNLLGD